MIASGGTGIRRHRGGDVPRCRVSAACHTGHGTPRRPAAPRAGRAGRTGVRPDTRRAGVPGLRRHRPWEHACGAGSQTLFRWGDECPLDRIPYGDDTGPHRRPNALGLRIAHDTYRAELTSDVTAVHGGGGGGSVCGGYGRLLAWLPPATANRNPGTAEFVYGPDGEDMYGDFSTRPVLPL